MCFQCLFKRLQCGNCPDVQWQFVPKFWGTCTKRLLTNNFGTGMSVKFMAHLFLTKSIVSCSGSQDRCYERVTSLAARFWSRWRRSTSFAARTPIRRRWYDATLILWLMKLAIVSIWSKWAPRFRTETAGLMSTVPSWRSGKPYFRSWWGLMSTRNSVLQSFNFSLRVVRSCFSSLKHACSR